MNDLFEMDVVEGSFRVGLIRLKSGEQHRITFSSERLPVYEIHFIGRGFICPDSLGLGGPKSCPACGVHAKRLLGLGITGTERYIQFVEFGAPSLGSIDAQRRESSLLSITGTKWWIGRRSNKRPLEVKYEGLDPTASRAPISDTAIMRAICRLYMLPNPSASWAWSEFGARIAETLHRQIRRQLLA